MRIEPPSDPLGEGGLDRVEQSSSGGGFLYGPALRIGTSARVIGVPPKLDSSTVPRILRPAWRLLGVCRHIHVPMPSAVAYECRCHRVHHLLRQS